MKILSATIGLGSPSGKKIVHEIFPDSDIERLNGDVYCSSKCNTKHPRRLGARRFPPKHPEAGRSACRSCDGVHKRTAAALLAIVGFVTCGVPTASSATLLNQTINADIAISGQDDRGFYTLGVFNGPVSVGTGFNDDLSVFKQLTQDGFATQSNQISGDVLLNITVNAISVTMRGQVQPFGLESVFTGIGVGTPHGAIVGDVGSATGVISGVNLVLFNNFEADSLDFATFYLGYQTGTNLTQTETLTFGAVPTTPLPATWTMMLLGLAGLSFVAYRQSRKGTAVIAA
jgi:hypothetical protein